MNPEAQAEHSYFAKEEDEKGTIPWKTGKKTGERHEPAASPSSVLVV